MLYSLTEIQRLAYQLDRDRCSRDLLRFHMSALKFIAFATEIFTNLKSVSTRAFFGTSYHSIVLHMPETYRYISLKSLATDAAENMVTKLRLVFCVAVLARKSKDILMCHKILIEHYQT